MARFSLVLLLLLFSAAAGADKPWQDSPHGPMLERIIPPGFTAAMLPEANSREHNNQRESGTNAQGESDKFGSPTAVIMRHDRSSTSIRPIS